MKLITSVLLFMLCVPILACEVKVLNSCRDGFTKNISQSKVRSATKALNRDQLLRKEIDQLYNVVTTDHTHQDFFNDFLKLAKLAKSFATCESDQENSKLYCLRLTLAPIIYYGYGEGHLDATATILLLSKLKSPKKAAFTGELNHYALKIKLLRKSYLLRQKKVSNEGSPLSKKKYLKRFGKLKRLTPRQNTLYKYNYSQIKKMGKIMQTLEKRILAQSSGLYYDYDGDGTPDEVYELDEAEKYRMSVKLLRLELEKQSFSDGVFADEKPDYHDLLVASNELGLVSDEDLEAMIELPYLYEEKPTFWQKAKSITWDIGKGVVMAIPGVNLYSIIPIVLVESYSKAKEKAGETSDLHLFTF